MKQSSSKQQVHLRRLTKAQAAEEGIYRKQLISSWAKRPRETWEEKYRREQMENEDD
jgi:hypothetical protein